MRVLLAAPPLFGHVAPLAAVGAELVARGHDVVIVDNLSRRKIDVELEVASLTPIRPLGERVRAWAEVTGNHIRTEDLTVGQDYDRLLALFSGRVLPFDQEAARRYADMAATAAAHGFAVATRNVQHSAIPASG